MNYSINNIFRLKDVNYFYRDYKNDLPDREETDFSQSMRIIKVALPFLGLYQPLGKMIAAGSSLARAYTSTYRWILTGHLGNKEIRMKPLVDTAIAVASLVGTLSFHPIGMLVSSSHDIGLNVYGLYGAIKTRDGWEVVKQTIGLSNNTFYLFTMISLSVELQVASLAIQVIACSIASFEEFKQGNWLEGCASVLMTAVRVNQFIPRVHRLQRKWAVEEAIKSIEVGELHEKWQFPSDHLPVGVKIDDFRVVSWNVLNNAYMKWVVEKDSQGLNGSMISDLQVKIQSNGLTARDVRIVDMLQSMTKSTEVIALQECGSPFLEKLEENLPSNWKIVKTFDRPVVDQDVILYDSSRFSYRGDQSEVSLECYPSVPGRPILNAVFEKVNQNGNLVRIFNAHIPGDPTLPAREEFAKYVKQFDSTNQTTVALGDNNFERNEMIDAYQKAGFLDFELHSPWHTNIDPYTKRSKAIDHIFVKGGASRDLEPDEVLNDQSHLKETIEILKKEKKNFLQKSRFA